MRGGELRGCACMLGDSASGFLKVGVRVLAPEEGLGVTKPDMREEHLEAINRFRNI